MTRNGLVALALAACASVAAAQSPVCYPDCDADRALTIADFGCFQTKFALAQPYADCNADGVLNLSDFGCFQTKFALGCADQDGDGLPDAVETDNGVFAGPTSTGTDPTDPDTDGDGLDDGDEVLGTLGGLDLPGAGVSPLRKNVLVEVDWQDDSFGSGNPHTHRPTPSSIARIKAAFDAALVENPYGAPMGITIIVDYGQGPAPLDRGNRVINGAPEFISFDSGFNPIKAANFDANRKGYFHYCVTMHRYNSATNNSSGVAEINGDDFMVTLTTVQTDTNYANTFMHEIGHNFNLRHGGNENRNYKPNYNSVMNYRFQFPGIDTTCDARGDGLLAYSSGGRLTLNETMLMESIGVCGAGFPIDWDGGGISVVPVARNINCPINGTQPCGTQGSCYDDDCNVLSDHNDWAALRYDNLSGGDATQEAVECDNPPP